MHVNDFPFGELLKKTWGWTYKNKILWIIALFAGSGGYFLNFIPNGDDMNSLTGGEGSVATALENTKAIGSDAPFILFAILAILALVAVFYLIGLAARAAIISGVGEINSGKKYRFWKLVGGGFKKVPRILLMGIIMGLPNILFLLLMVFGGWLGAWYGITLLSVSGLAFLLYNIYITILRHYSYCEAILKEKTSWDAITSGVKIVNKNFWVVVVTALIQIGLSMGIGIGTFIALLIMAVPFVVLGAIMALGLGALGMLIPAILGGLTFVVLIMALKGGINFFFNGFLTNVYWKIEK
jgi:hypothetical protein